MGLLWRGGNTLFSGPGGFASGAGTAGSMHLGAPTAGSLQGRFSSSALPKTAGVPSGYREGGSWSLPRLAGELASTVFISGVGTLDSAAAGGKNAEAALSGVGDFTAPPPLQLIVSAIAALTGTGALSGNALATLQAAASLAGSGSFTSAIGAIASVISSITGSGSPTASLTATGTLSATLTPFTSLSPQSLAQAVWESLVADFDTAGTFGEAVGGSSASPAQVAAAVLGALVEGSITLAESIRIINAILAGKVSGAGAGAGTEAFRNLADTKDRVVATMDASGNRTVIVIDPSEP